MIEMNRYVMSLLVVFLLMASIPLVNAIYVIPSDTPYKKDLGVSNAGDLKYKGMTILTGAESKYLSKNDIGVSISIDSPDGFRDFDVKRTNGLVKVSGPVKRASRSLADESMYVMTGKRWNVRDPQLKFVLRNDAVLASEGLTTINVVREINTAIATWDNASNQNLFSDVGTISVNPSIVIDSYNKVNTIGWKLFSNNCLAYARTWYKSSLVDGYKTIVDSDITFNTKYPWRTSGTVGADVQTIVLHEFGHSLGLGDLYASSCSGQVMYGYYTRVSRVLGNGDVAGIRLLYN
jgi:hypothetical protein